MVPLPDETCNTVRIEELEKRMELITRLHEREVDATAEKLEARLNAMNEFREQLTLQASTFLSRAEFYWAIAGIILTLVTLFVGVLVQTQHP